MSKKEKKIIKTLAGIIFAIVIIVGAVWLITGRSPQSIVVRSALHQMTMCGVST